MRPLGSIRQSLMKIGFALLCMCLASCVALANAAESVIFASGAGYVEGDTSAVGVLNGMYGGPEYDKYFLNTYDKYTPNTDDPSVDTASNSIVSLIEQIQAADPGGKITYVGSSLGGAAGSETIDKLIASGYPTDNLKFVLIVNPQDPNGGYAARFTGLGIAAPFTGLTGSPTQSTGSQVTSYKGQYDLISDFPAYAFNGLAIINAAIGFLYVHPKVFDVNLDDPRNVSVTSPNDNMTSTLLYTSQLPLTQPLLAMGVPQRFVAALDPFLRAIIETAYVRPNLADPTNPANDPSRLIPLQFLPPIGAWIPSLVSIAAGAVESVRLLIQAVLPVQQVAVTQLAPTQAPAANARLADVTANPDVRSDISTTSTFDVVSDSVPAKAAVPEITLSDVVSSPSSKQSVVSEPIQAHETTSSAAEKSDGAAETASESTTSSTKEKESTSTSNAENDKDASDDSIDSSSDKSTSDTTSSSSSSGTKSSSQSESHSSKISDNSSDSSKDKSSSSSASGDSSDSSS